MPVRSSCSNSPFNGYPIAIMEGALISAVRTAASAALAVDLLHTVDESVPIGLVGSGRINFEVARVLTTLHPRWREVVVFDLSAANIDRFEAAMAAARPGVRVRRVDSVARVCECTSLIAIATSAIEPHIESLGSAGPGSTVLPCSFATRPRSSPAAGQPEFRRRCAACNDPRDLAGRACSRPNCACRRSATS